MVYNNKGKIMQDYMKGNREVKISGRGTLQKHRYYFAVRCRSCKTWRVKITKNLGTASFKCSNCKKNESLRVNRCYGYNEDYSKCNTLKEARAYVKKMNDNVKI
jgi:predicted RNA-binding Zn-ribbon protein involved in translation (DUF1610 family)